MKDVCDKHGALLILDGVMSGMGRTGTLHAWEQEGIVPDLQTIAKGLGAGYSPIGALLVNRRVVDTLLEGTGAFAHSQTYQGHPVACAAACKVQEIIQSDGLLANVRTMGEYLGQLLKDRLSAHPNVGDIRGRGLFWAVSISPVSVDRLPGEADSKPRWNLLKIRKRSSHSLLRDNLLGRFTRRG